jgi:hypothetical protein
MKAIKILFILSLITLNSLRAQTYNFDYKIKIKHEHMEQSYYFLNSKDPSYKILMFNDQGSLWDSKEEKSRRYFFNYSEKNSAKPFDFKEILEFIPTDELIIAKITAERLSENKYLIKSFKKENSKKTNLELIVNLMPFEADLMYFYFLDVSHNIQIKLMKALKDQLGGNYNYYISDYSINYRNGVKRHLFIEKIEPINLKVMIPTKQ